MKHSRQRVVWAGASGVALLSLFSLSLPANAASHPPLLMPQQAHLVSPQAQSGMTPLAPVSSNGEWTFGIVLPSHNPSGLAHYAQSVSNPKSPLYHHYLSHAQVMSRYGPSPMMVHAAELYLRSHGFSVQRDGQMLSAKGTVAEVNRLFSTRLERYREGHQQVVAPVGAITIPSALRTSAGVTGLVTNSVTPQLPSHLVPANRMPRLAYAPAASMAPAPSGIRSTVTQNGLTVTAQRLSQGPRVPGMAFRYLITVKQNGVPDPNAGFASLSGPFKGASSVVDTSLTNSNGQFLADFTLSQAQTVSLAMTVANFNSSGQATATATVQLPRAVFRGPSAATTSASSLFGTSATGTIVAPWNPASNSVVKALHGQALSQETQINGPAHLAVYTAGNVASVSENDVAMFSQKFNLPPLNVSVAYTGPNACATDSCGLVGIEQEMSLDLQMMETAAPGSDVQVYEAGSLRSALNQVATQDTAQVFSISYGAGELAEQAYAPGAQQDWDMLAEEANAEGITISVSAGDSGAFEGAQEGLLTPMPSYPANSPYVSSLGGTEASVSPMGTLNQVAMWGGNIGKEISTVELLSFLQMQNMIAGGGYSTLEPVPFYQWGLVPPGAGRGNPDFSLPASVVTPGYFTYLGGTPYYVGGTSASAPLFAGFMGDLALGLHTSLGNVNPLLYFLDLADPAVMTTVAYGNNGVYSVTPGYNAATGLGQINFGQLYQALLGPSMWPGPGGPGLPGPGPAPHPGPGPGWPGPGRH